MNQINAVTLGKLIAAHREGDEPYTIYCGFRIDYPYILWYNANVLRKGATSKSPEHAPVAQLAEQLSCNQ